MLLIYNPNISTDGFGQVLGQEYRLPMRQVKGGKRTPGHTQVVTVFKPYKLSLLFLGFLSQFASHLVPQPDNAEYLLQRSGVTVEACLAGMSEYSLKHHLWDAGTSIFFGT